MKVVVAGASGFLGSALAKELAGNGHTITRLVRREPANSAEIQWDPSGASMDPRTIAGFDAVIGLSGAGISSHRWTASYKQTLRDSRIGPTKALASAIAAVPADERPKIFISASAIGYYGERGDQSLPETAAAGHGFLADLVVDWEAATRPAIASGTRVAFIRTGLVLAKSGGLLKLLIPIYKLGAGGTIGSGQHYQSWISLADEIGAIRHVLESDTVAGPVNLTAPTPVRFTEFAKKLGAVLHRPALLPTPAFAVRLALGEFADEGVLVSQRVIPELLTQSGYTFRHPDLGAALSWAVQN